MTKTLQQSQQRDFVTAPLKYLADDKGLAVYIASTGGGDTTQLEGNYCEHRVRIHNGRLREATFNLDHEGFTILFQASGVSDFYDEDEIRDIYETEIKALLIETTGARRVEIFDHTRRSASRDLQQQRMIREPATVVHNDYTARSGINRLRDHFATRPQDLAQLIARRFAIVNVWRSMTTTVETAPLAFCDASTVTPGDLISVKRRAKERIGEIQQSLFNANHRWFYFPQLTRDEVLLIKTFDSSEDGRARFTLHTSFQDPHAAHDAAPRESLETRCFLFF
jgi:hypothetical protein